MPIHVRLLILVCSFGWSYTANAHQPDLSSTLLAAQADGTWVLQIRAALTAFEYEVEQHFGEAAYDTPEKFRQLVLRHVEDRVSIKFNGEAALLLQEGTVVLGHETTVRLELRGPSEAIRSLTVRNGSFQEIHHNQSSLIVLMEGMAKESFVLEDDNAHTAELVVRADRFELVTSSQSASILPTALLLSLGTFALLLFGYLTYRKRAIN